jgi:autotransporter-associated beta strand protein
VPRLVLTLAYWLHMAATVVWIGGLTFQTLILAPALEGSPEVLERLRRRFDPLAWLSLAVLIGTGLLQMSANSNYTGLLSIRNGWSAAILAKHLVIGLMLLLASIQTWWIQPRLTRLVLIATRAPHQPADVAVLRRRQLRLLRLQTVLSVVVLALTAAARSA